MYNKLKSIVLFLKILHKQPAANKTCTYNNYHVAIIIIFLMLTANRLTRVLFRLNGMLFTDRLTGVLFRLYNQGLTQPNLNFDCQTCCLFKTLTACQSFRHLEYKISVCTHPEVLGFPMLKVLFEVFSLSLLRLFQGPV